MHNLVVKPKSSVSRMFVLAQGGYGSVKTKPLPPRWQRCVATVGVGADTTDDIPASASSAPTPCTAGRRTIKNGPAPCRTGLPGLVDPEGGASVRAGLVSSSQSRNQSIDGVPGG